MKFEHYDSVYESGGTDYSDTRGDRYLVAEVLENRILYSAAPVDVSFDDVFESEEFGDDQSWISFAAESAGIDTGSESIYLNTLNHLSSEELASLAETVVDKGRTADLDEEQKELIDALEISLIDVFSLAEPEIDVAVPALYFDSGAPVDAFSFSGTTFDLYSEPVSDELDTGFIGLLVPDLEGPVQIEVLAGELVARREQTGESEAVSPPEAHAFETDTSKIVEVAGSTLGYGGKSTVFLDIDIAEQMGCADNCTRYS